jgi:hypothetical protein
MEAASQRSSVREDVRFEIESCIGWAPSRIDRARITHSRCAEATASLSFGSAAIFAMTTQKVSISRRALRVDVVCLTRLNPRLSRSTEPRSGTPAPISLNALATTQRPKLAGAAPYQGICAHPPTEQNSSGAHDAPQLPQFLASF